MARGLLALLVSSGACAALAGFISTLTPGASEARRAEFVAALTTLEQVTYNGVSEAVRAVHSSGGAAGGVVTEGQGYGILVGGITLAGMTPAVGDSTWDTAVQETYEMYLGWRHMCRLSAASQSCQSPFYCGMNCPFEGSSSDQACYPCLPHWKFKDDLSAAVGTGAAPDGDEDAMVGMLLLLLATSRVKAHYAWWYDLARIMYQSCKQFYVSNTVDGTGQNAGLRLLKLGSCWGGFGPNQCNNPSYHAPGAMRAFRDYMAAYESIVGAPADDGTNYIPLWNTVVKSTYLMLKDNQCPASGLTTNWFSTGEPLGSGLGDVSCSGSGTPAAEFGSEASRGVWRVVMDSLWYAEETAARGGPDLSSTGTGFGPQDYLERITSLVASKHQQGSTCPACWDKDLATDGDHVGCFVNAVHASWEWNAFMCGPVFTSLVREVASVDSATQRAALDAAGTTIASFDISGYYAGSWVALATMTLNGDLQKAGALIAAMKQPLTCTLLSAAPLGYDISGMSCAQLTNVALTCQGATCSPGYAGEASYTCTADGAPVTLEGCREILQCAPPATMPVGYFLSGASCASLSSNSLSCTGVASCDESSYYVGTVTYTACTSYGGEVIVGGCSLDECTAGVDNCDFNATCLDTASGFSCICKTGFSGLGTQGTCVAVSSGQGSQNCHLATCGCAPFDGGEHWCSASSARIQSDWCDESESNCISCNGVWCDAPPLPPCTGIGCDVARITTSTTSALATSTPVPPLPPCTGIGCDFAHTTTSTLATSPLVSGIADCGASVRLSLIGFFSTMAHAILCSQLMSKTSSL